MIRPDDPTRSTFEAGFDADAYHFAVTFGKQETVPVPVRKSYQEGDSVD